MTEIERAFPFKTPYTHVGNLAIAKQKNFWANSRGVNIHCNEFPITQSMLSFGKISDCYRRVMR
jgi:hypothetical protein